MADIVDKATRSRVMAQIRKKWTSPERRLHGLLKAHKVRHKMYPHLSGSPDALVYPRTLVFLDGCFWHGCPRCYVPPKTRTDYWHPKIQGNRRRDRHTRKLLRAQGWTVVSFWEHQFRHDSDRCLARILGASPVVG